MSAIPIPYDIEPHPLTKMYNGKFGVWLFLASEVMLFGALFSAYILLRVGAPPNTWPMHGLVDTHGSQILNVKMATLNTLILISSSVTMVLAWASLHEHNLAKARTYLIITLLCASGFLVVKFFEYKAKFEHYQITFKQAPEGELAKIVKPVSVQTATGTHDMYVITGHKHAETETAVEFIPDPPKDAPEGAEAEHHPISIDKSLIKRMTFWGPQASTFLAIYFTLTGLHGLHVIGGMVVMLYLLLTSGKMWRTQPEKFINRIECTGLYWHFVDLVWIFLFPVLYLL